jgi:glycosyltransferase involved in cell wall biosynthesis
VSEGNGGPSPLRFTEALTRDFVVVVPAFDEAPVVPDLIRELRSTFRAHGLEGEVILVDDGSTDGTGDLAAAEASDWPCFRVLRHGVNLGKTEAILTAAEATDRSVIVVFDADLQHSTEEIPRFLEKLAEGWDIVCGRKVGDYDKQAVSSVYNRLSRAMFNVPVSDLNSMKAFRKSVLDEVRLRHDWHRFFVVLAHARGHSVTEIDIPLHPRRAGVSKYSGFLRVVVGFVDLLSVWFLTIFSRKPLLLFGTFGVALVLLGFVIGLVAIYLRVFHGFGFRPILTLVLLLETVGFTVFGFGLVAEMVAALREEVDSLRRAGNQRRSQGRSDGR